MARCTRQSGAPQNDGSFLSEIFLTPSLAASTAFARDTARCPGIAPGLRAAPGQYSRDRCLVPARSRVLRLGNIALENPGFLCPDDLCARRVCEFSMPERLAACRMCRPVCPRPHRDFFRAAIVLEISRAFEDSALRRLLRIAVAGSCRTMRMRARSAHRRKSLTGAPWGSGDCRGGLRSDAGAFEGAKLVTSLRPIQFTLTQYFCAAIARGDARATRSRQIDRVHIHRPFRAACQGVAFRVPANQIQRAVQLAALLRVQQ